MKQTYEIGQKDKNGIQIRLGDVIMAGMKDFKGNISGWSKEIVMYMPQDKEIGLTHYDLWNNHKKIEFGQIPKDSDCLEVI